MVPDQVRRLKELERENAGPNQLVDLLSLDKSILEESLGKVLSPAADAGDPGTADAGYLRASRRPIGSPGR